MTPDDTCMLGKTIGNRLQSSAVAVYIGYDYASSIVTPYNIAGISDVVVLVSRLILETI